MTLQKAFEQGEDHRSGPALPCAPIVPSPSGRTRAIIRRS